MKKSILLETLFILVLVNLKPISESGAKWVGIGVGAGVGLFVGSGVFFNSSDNQYGRRDQYNRMNQREPIQADSGDILTAVLLGGIAGSLAGYLAYKLAMYNTPKAKFNRANDIINKVLLEDLVAKKFRNSDLYVRYALGRFSSNWPLVDARKKLDSIRLNLLEARSLLSAACSELGSDYRYSYMYNSTKDLNEVIDDFLDRIPDRMSVLISHPFYKDQMKRYEKYQKEERRRRERERERWERRTEKSDERWERRREKERDREFLQGFAGNRPANVGINFNMG